MPGVILFFALILIVLLPVLICWRWLERLTLSTSTALKELEVVNANTAPLFSSEYNRSIQIVVRCKSKTQFDAKSLRQCLSQYLSTHYKSYYGIFPAVKADMAVYQEYEREYLGLREKLGLSWREDLRVSRQLYEKTEKRLFARRKLPSPQFRLDVRKTYTSPKKHNHYSDQAYFYGESFIDICSQIFSHEEKKRNIAKERRIMTNELRYQILQRDGFRCQICGRTQEDGVILHVDHIKPVSKGGLTEPGNLRVLCAECNLGKSNRYDPAGLN